jgi:hypothetical protein
LRRRAGRAHARAHERADRQDDLPAALHLDVQPAGQVRAAVLERVADDAAPAEVDDRQQTAGAVVSGPSSAAIASSASSSSAAVTPGGTGRVQTVLMR